MQASPPDTTEIWGLVSEATSPASKFPSLGPPVTTMMWIADMRPRSASGTASWRIVERNTALSTSAAPATARSVRASQNSRVTRPNAVMAAPHPITAQITARPWCRMRLTHPVVRAPRRAPADGAA